MHKGALDIFFAASLKRDFWNEKFRVYFSCVQPIIIINPDFSSLPLDKQSTTTARTIIQRHKLANAFNQEAGSVGQN